MLMLQADVISWSEETSCARAVEQWEKKHSAISPTLLASLKDASLVCPEDPVKLDSGALTVWSTRTIYLLECPADKQSEIALIQARFAADKPYLEQLRITILAFAQTVMKKRNTDSAFTVPTGENTYFIPHNPATLDGTLPYEVAWILERFTAIVSMGSHWSVTCWFGDRPLVINTKKLTARFEVQFSTEHECKKTVSLLFTHHK